MDAQDIIAVHQYDDLVLCVISQTASREELIQYLQHPKTHWTNSMINVMTRLTQKYKTLNSEKLEHKSDSIR